RIALWALDQGLQTLCSNGVGMVVETIHIKGVGQCPNILFSNSDPCLVGTSQNLRSHCRNQQGQDHHHHHDLNERKAGLSFCCLSVHSTRLNGHKHFLF